MGRSSQIKTGLGTQAAALCWRRHKDDLRVLLITSRTTRRWVLPKGWLMPGRSADEAAAIEAWEEAGARGRIDTTAIGQYRYVKVGEGKQDDQRCVVEVFALQVEDLADAWPEQSQRTRRWMSRKKAASAVWEPELSRLIKQFSPKLG